ncbi:MAG: cell division protein FtsQ, partial [Bacteroidota bacterium]
SGVLKDLFELLHYIDRDDFLKPLIEQVYVDQKKEYILIPKIGKENILLGSMDYYETKFENLEIFYKEGLRNVGWNKYKSIDLSIENQIICEKIEQEN